MNAPNYTFYEFDSVTGGAHGQLTEKIFAELKQLALPFPAEDRGEGGTDADLSSCLTLGVKGGKEVIRFKNYVGTISLPDGATVEILPKTTQQNDAAQSRKIVVEMLKLCGNIPYRSFRNANVQTETLNLFEIYIRLFLDELYALSRKGFRAGYVAEEANEPFLRGKLLFKEQIRYNSVHRERFYVGRDDFNVNRAENRLIKTTLEILKKLCADEKNRRDIRRFLLLFDEIPRSENVERDLMGCADDRTMEDYLPVLKLCKIFLRGRGFSVFGGEHNVVSLLFPMEKLFERYVAQKMRGYSHAQGWKQYDQIGSMSLFDGKQFTLRPDILLKKDGKTVIVDTKWKRLLGDKRENGISQADMYQMYAYHTRYPAVSRAILLYPLCERIAIEDYVIRDMNIRVGIRFFDLQAAVKGASFEACIFPRPIFSDD